MPRGSKPGERRGGRKPGTPNKATEHAKSLFAAFHEANQGRVQGLWEAVAEKDPALALRLFVDMAEFHVPKLARTELSADGSGLKKLVIEWQQ